MTTQIDLHRTISPCVARRLLNKAHRQYGLNIRPLGISKTLRECMFTAKTPTGTFAYFWFNVPALGNTTKSVHVLINQ